MASGVVISPKSDGSVRVTIPPQMGRFFVSSPFQKCLCKANFVMSLVMLFNSVLCDASLATALFIFLLNGTWLEELSSLALFKSVFFNLFDFATPLQVEIFWRPPCDVESQRNILIMLTYVQFLQTLVTNG